MPIDNDAANEKIERLFPTKRERYKTWNETPWEIPPNSSRRNEFWNRRLGIEK